MPTKTSPKAFYTSMTEHEFAYLHKKAAARGKKNFTRLLNVELHRVYESFGGQLPQCDSPSVKKKMFYLIPEDLQPFYQQLACFYGIPVSVLIFRMVVSPMLLEMYHTTLPAAGLQSTPLPDLG